jgi:carboxyl-terminal processing protease
MPARNVIFLLAAALGCLAVRAVLDRELPGRRFNEVVSVIAGGHLDPVDAEDLLDEAIRAAVARLDEHSAYLRGADREAFASRLEQRFAGVGLELVTDDRGDLVVAAPVVGGPAWRAGIAAGDRIQAIDGVPTRHVPLDECVARLRGHPGAPVSLRMRRIPEETATLDPGKTAEESVADVAGTVRDVPLVREIVRIESVLGDRRREDASWEWLVEGEPDVALIRITSFGERTVAELDVALAGIASGPTPCGLILDLRGNAGGLLAAAVETCDRFLDEGEIVITRRRQDGDGPPGDVRRATPGCLLAGVPMAVLVDGLTASSAEVVAACLQDRGRAVIVGSRTSGKGTVQTVVPLAHGDGLLRLTAAEYLRPSGGRIHRAEAAGDDAEWGVRPDAGCEVAPTGEALERLHAWRRLRDLPGMTGERPMPGSMSVPTGRLPREVDDVLAASLGNLRSAE